MPARNAPPSPRSNLIEKLIPGVRYPWLLAILAGLFAVDLVVPDPIPLLDEVLLAVLTVVAASWRRRRDEPRPPPIDVTPPDDAAQDTGDGAPGRSPRPEGD
jgi:hypothetical protein